MTPAISLAKLGAAPVPDRRDQLHKLSRQLEGVFLNQLFQAMRASVPQEGLLTQNPGQEMFTQMFDERMAAEAADHMKHGLSEALYRQLAGRLGDTTEAPKP
jgi:Rod binding domain-containing protein